MKARSLYLALSAVVLVSLLLSACSGGSKATPTSSIGDAAAGKTLFESTCAGCHGADAKGMPDRGVDLTTSTFVKNTSPSDLVAFITTGRPSSDPNSLTKRTMPAKGGNPDLTTQDLTNIVAYLKTLNP